MSTFLLTAYILVWPLVSAVLLAVLCIALWRDAREAKRLGQDLV
ncbi:putative transporter small subunit [Paracandidimonas soli]|uniref:Uncharacterized protein n=1 Tax=Paracandidimonas soli TaxID=1917182 RepID=A0A4V2VSN5_9BURK|nr:putative transporter small subunit [Paracandidimonas soli]TCV03110.1 hypothetical protein EV686_101572 [Paracandidimonas soli]